MIQFSHPEAFLMVPLWGVAAWMLPRAELWKPLRILTGLLLMLAWANPHLPRQSRGLDVWMLVDRSSSAAEWIEPRLPEMESLLEQSRGRHDRLFFVDFAEDVIVRETISEAILSGRMDATHIGGALQYTLSRLDPGRHSRLLMVTDGFSTEPLEDAALRLNRENVPMDLRLIAPVDVTDFRVDELRAPNPVRPGEAFILEARVFGNADADVPVELWRDGQRVGGGVAAVRRGRAAVRWSEVLPRPGAVEYEVRILPETDAWAGNNRQTRWVEARGGRRLLLVTAYADDPMVPVLRAQGVEVELVTDPARLRPGHLTGTAAVVIHNVPAYDLPNPFIDALPFYVREQGGGLAMIGGRLSFGAGGYYQSSVDELLPVSMELKEEHRRLSVAMAIVMDRSGSMAAGVPGAPGMTKMGLANEGAAQAIELLGDRDAVTVFAVDTSPHVIVPMTTLGENREQITGMVRRIQSHGGGIYVYEGLKAGWEELQKAEQGQRHIILFSDASDSERPQGYERIVDDMLADNATLSVIALGNERDRHADLLKEIAARGQGRIMFNDDAATLPSIFAQETVALSRSAFLDEPVALQATAGWQELAAAQLNWPAQVDGYNLSYLRPEATAGLLSADEYEAPLVAHWTRGTGRVAAIAFPTGGEYSESVRAWPQYADFVRTVFGWILRPELPPGLALRHERVGETLNVELLYDESWEDTFARTPPRLLTAAGVDLEGRTHVWRRIAPGTFQTRLDMAGTPMLRGALQVGNRAMPFGPLTAGTGAEWRFDPAMPRALRQMSEVSGGVNRIDLASIWEAPRRVELRGIRNALLLATLLAFLAEALWTRLDGQRPSVDFRAGKAPKRPRFRKPKPEKPQAAPETVPPQPEVKRRTVFDQARRR